jgi:cellulose synthase/poly-beta-1,6-N-acetylglucosamine synthase-like glycosyltransferase
VIPAYNEEETIEEVVRISIKYADVCVINDYSWDTTPEILNRTDDIHVIHHKVNTHILGGLCKTGESCLPVCPSFRGKIIPFSSANDRTFQITG